MIRQAWGLALDVCYHRALSAEPLPSASEAPDAFGIATPFARTDRLYDGLHGADRICRLPGFQRWYAYVTPGEAIGPVSNGFQNYLYIEFRQPDTARLRQSLLAVSDIDVYGEQPTAANTKHILLIGGRDSGLDWDTARQFRFTLVQQPGELSDYQRERATLVLTPDIADLPAYSTMVERLHRNRHSMPWFRFRNWACCPRHAWANVWASSTTTCAVWKSVATNCCFAICSKAVATSCPLPLSTMVPRLALSCCAMARPSSNPSTVRAVRASMP